MFVTTGDPGRRCCSTRTFGGTWGSVANTRSRAVRSTATAAVDTSGPGLTGRSRNPRRGRVQPPVRQLKRRRDRGRAGAAAILIREALQPRGLYGQFVGQLSGGECGVGLEQRRGRIAELLGQDTQVRLLRQGS